MTERTIVKRIAVQPGLDVLIEDTHNILIELSTPDGTVLGRSGALTNIDRLTDLLQFARTWAAITEREDENDARETRT